MTTETIPARVDPRFRGGMAATATIDVRAPQAPRSSRNVEGEVRFDAGSEGAVRDRRLQLPPGPDRRCDPQDAGRRRRHPSRAATSSGRRSCCRGGGTQPVGRDGQLRRGDRRFTKYLHGIGDADADTQTVICQPGAINEQVNEKTGTQIGMVFGPDPSTHSRCTIGGNVGNNSCGIHSVQAQLYGPGPRTSDNVEALEIVTYDGDRFWVGVRRGGAARGDHRRRRPQGRDLRPAARPARPLRRPDPRALPRRSTDLPRRVSGYNLDELLPERGFNVARALVGTESTCATALQVKLKLTPGAATSARSWSSSTTSIAEAAEHVMEIIEWKPIGLEALDHG